MGKRVLFIENSRSDLAIGGSHKSLHALISGLDKKKYLPILLLNEKSIFLKYFDDLNIPVFYLNHEEWDLKKIRMHMEKISTAKENADRGFKGFQKYRYQLAIMVRLIHTIIPMTIKTIQVVKKYNVNLIHTNTRIGSNQHGILAGWLTHTMVVSHERWWTPNNWFNRFIARRINKIIKFLFLMLFFVMFFFIPNIFTLAILILTVWFLNAS